MFLGRREILLPASVRDGQLNLYKCLVQQLDTDWETKLEPLATVRYSVMRKNERKTIFVGKEIYLLTRGGLISVGPV